MAENVKVKASGTPEGGKTVVSISGGEPGGHTASIRFLGPDYGPVFHRFDGGEGLIVTNDHERSEVIVSVDEGPEYRVEVTPYKPGRGKVTDDNRGDKARAGDPDAISAIANVARNIGPGTTDEISVAENDEEVKKVDTSNVNIREDDPGADGDVVARPGMNPDDVGKTQEAIDHPKKAVATPDDPASPHGPPEDDTSEKSDHKSDDAKKKK